MPYHQTARFADEPSAGRAYTAAQRAIFAGPPNDLSAYRFQLNTVDHVTVLGELPPHQLAEQLAEILAHGTPAQLPPEVLSALTERRRQMSRRGLWSEGQYRPGRPL
ncbi:MAG: hypothetical protein M3336_00855 [Chloroflexota bacterium]|nr:hypothetical protein [Chloroflexota bacterium]